MGMSVRQRTERPTLASQEWGTPSTRGPKRPTLASQEWGAPSTHGPKDPPLLRKNGAPHQHTDRKTHPCFARMGRPINTRTERPTFASQEWGTPSTRGPKDPPLLRNNGAPHQHADRKTHPCFARMGHPINTRTEETHP